MNIPLIINIVVFVGLIFLLAQTRKTDWSLSKKVLAGLVLGVVFGLGLHLIYGGGHPILAESISWFNIVGNGYVKLFTNGRDAFGICVYFGSGGKITPSIFFRQNQFLYDRYFYSLQR